MKERSKSFNAELSDGLYLAVIVVFTGWVALTQAATLAAPIAALFTAVLLTPKANTAHDTLAGQLHRPLVAIGTTLTAFLWLLSAAQPEANILPTNAAEAFIILIGLVVATTMVVVSPIVFVMPRLMAAKNGSNTPKFRYADYVLGILCSIVVFVLLYFMLKVSENLIGPIQHEMGVIAFGVAAAPALGWFIVFSERNRKSRLSQEP